MPIYAMIYLFLFFLFAFSTTYMHFEEGRGTFYILPEALSYTFLVTFVIMYYHQDKVKLDLAVVFPMLIYSALWEAYSFKQDVLVARDQFGIKGRELMLYSSIAIVFALPTYLAGLAVIF